MERLAREVLGNDGPLYSMSLNGNVSVDDFLGAKTLNGGNIEHLAGPALRAMQRRRPLIINELDAATPEVLFWFQQVLEGKEVLLSQVSDERGEPLRINPRAEDDKGQPSAFTILATANTLGRGDATGMYRGTSPLNEAFLDRFWVINMDYPPPKEEAKILMRRAGVSAWQAQRMAQVAGLARNAFREGQQLGSSFSVRKSMRWAQAVASFGYQMKEGFQLAVLESASHEDRSVLEEIYQRVTSDEIVREKAGARP